MVSITDMMFPNPGSTSLKLTRGSNFLKATVIYLGLLSIVSSVKREDFKSCSESAFCRRNRQLAKDILSATTKDNAYVIQPNSINFSQAKFTADVLSPNDNIMLELGIYFLDNEAVRIRVDEKAPIRPRYDEAKHHVLVKEPILQDSESVSREILESGVHAISYSSGGRFKALVQPNPLKIDFLKDDDIILTFNERGLFNFEHFRVKEEADISKKVDENLGPILSEEPPRAEGEIEDTNEAETGLAEESEAKKEEVDLGLWEERFKGHTDPKKNGPSSIGLDVSFHGFQHVYGIPQHATSLSLKSTDGKEEGSFQDPYRLYNLDVFEYEVDNPMALYGSIPFMVGHRKGSSAGIFWLNSAEMWIDVGKETTSSNKTSHTHWISESGLVDLFVFIGDQPKTVLKQYGDLTGFTALPPMFSLGYHQCRWNYINDKDVAGVDAGFDEHDIPYDVLWLDIEHTDGKKYFTWDSVKFPDPKKNAG